MALVFTITYVVCLLVARANHIGFPMTTLTTDNMSALLKTIFAIEVIYYTIVFAVKSSILFMYLRFAISKRFLRLCQGTLVLLAVFYVTCLGGTIGQCQPVSKVWDITFKQPGTCNNTTAFFYFTSGFNIITDLWILLLPIPTLMSIGIEHKEKLVLYGVFGVGVFATAFSCVRLQSIYTYTLATDPYHDAISVNLWSMVEVNSAIFCANVPALKPLFQPRRLLETVRSGSGTNGKRYEQGYYEIELPSNREGSRAESSTSQIIIMGNESS
ncbi:integral membrane protein [Seiridium cupressi]